MKFQFTSLVTLLGLAVFVAADCCRSNDFGLCADKTAGTPCCGYGQCNIFCCNCDGGCRHDFAGGRLLEILTTDNGATLSEARVDAMACAQKFTHADLNGDGKVTFLEWVARTEGGSPKSFVSLAARWAKFDVEGKGYLTEEEAFERRA